MYYKTITAIVALFLLACTVNSQLESDALVLRWTYNVGKATEDFKGSLDYIELVDLDGDGNKEIIATTGGSIGTGKYELNNVIFAIRNNGSLFWKRGINDILRATFIDDFDRDGNPEIIVGAGRLIEELSRGRVYIIESDGSILRTYSSSSIIQSIYVTDLDRDRWSDIIGGSASKLYVFDSFGLIKWDKLLNSSTYIVRADDMTGDGYDDIISVSDDIALFKHDGTTIVSKKIEDITGYKNDKVTLLVTGSITPQKQKDLVFGTERSPELHVVTTYYNTSKKRYQLQKRWTFPISGRVTALSLGNLDDDENDEIIVGTSDDFVHAIDSDGQLLWSYELNGYATDIQISDINNDDRDDVVIGAISGTVYVLTRDKGKFQWRFDLDEPISMLRLGDLEGDNLTEVVVGTTNKNIFVYEVNISYTKRETANFYYQEAQRLYVNSEYNESMDFLLKAKSIYSKLGDHTNVDRADRLIAIINEKFTGLRQKQADAFYNKAQGYFIAGDYEKSMQFALESKDIYSEFGDTQNVLKAEILTKRIDRIIRAEVTLVPTTSLKADSDSKPKLTITTIFIIVLVLVVLVVIVRFVIKARRYAKTAEADMKEYEDDLDKVLDDDLESVSSMRTK